MAKLIVNRVEFAELLDCSPRQVSKWINMGMPAGDDLGQHKGKARQIDADLAVRWLQGNIYDQTDRYDQFRNVVYDVAPY